MNLPPPTPSRWNSNATSRDQFACGALVVVFLALAAYYSLVNPPFEAPDEVWHFAYVREIAQAHGLPVMLAGTNQPWAQEGTQAPLYYLLGAPLIAWMDSPLPLPAANPFARIGEPQAATNDNRNAFFHTAADMFPFQDTALALHLLRLYSAVLGGLTVAFTFALAREVFPDVPVLAPLAAAFVAFLPQFLFISAAVNNDNLATLLSTVFLWQLARVLRRGASARRAVLLGAMAGAALLTKFNTFTLIPLALVALFWQGAPRRAWRSLFLNMGLVVLAAALIAGPWYARNLLLYGDLSGVSLVIEMIGRRVAPLDPVRWFLAENAGLRFSTWGVFGWMDILAVPAFYTGFDLLALAGFVGMLVAAARRAWSVGATVLALWVAIVFAELVYYNLQLPAAQGRLLFPALAAWAALWARGILALLPSRAHRPAAVALGAALLLVAGLTPALYIAPAYAPTTAEALPVDALRVNAAFANGAEILGARLDRSEIEPGGAVDVTIVTALARPESARAALFVHLVDAADIIVAQRDSAIASGNWNGLDYPVQVADTLRVEVPVTAEGPGQWRVEIGLYDLDTGVRANEVGTGRNIFTIGLLPARDSSSTWGFDFGGRTVLDHAEITPERVAPGGSVRVALWWQVAVPDALVFVHALGSANHIWASADGPLTREMELVLTFDPGTPPGVYPLELGILPTSGDRLPVFDADRQLVGDRLFRGPVRVAP